MSSTIESPFRKGRAVVQPEWIDNNGHMNVGYYLLAFDNAAAEFFPWLGLTQQVRAQYHSSSFALESHLSFLRELRLGDPIRFESRLLGFDHKRFHFYQEMFHETEGYRAAAYESISSHMDMRTRRTAPMPEVLTRRLTEVMAEHGKLPRPPQVGHVISTRPRTGS